jgi:aspartate kinase
MASRMFSTLAQAQVNIEMISQGASEINISCVIEEAQAEKALRIVHDEIVLRRYRHSSSTDGGVC